MTAAGFGLPLHCPTAATRQPGEAAAVLQHHIGVGLLKLLPAQRHHVRHSVQVDGLVLVRDSAPDVAKFQGDPAGQLALDGEVERVNRVGPEIRIQGLGRRQWNVLLNPGKSGWGSVAVATGIGAVRPLIADAVGPTRKAGCRRTAPTATGTSCAEWLG